MLALKSRPCRINNERAESNKGQQRRDPPVVFAHRLTKSSPLNRNQIRCHKDEPAAYTRITKLFAKKVAKIYAKTVGKSRKIKDR